MTIGAGRLQPVSAEQLASELVKEQRALEEICKTLRKIVSNNLTGIAKNAENGEALANQGMTLVRHERGGEEAELRLVNSAFSLTRQAALRDAATRSLISVSAIDSVLENLLHDDVILIHIFEQLFIIISLIRTEVANRRAGKGQYTDENMAAQINHARKLTKIGEAIVFRDTKAIADNFKLIKRYFVARMHILASMA